MPILEELFYNSKKAAVDSQILLQKTSLGQGVRSIAAPPILDNIRHADWLFDAWEDTFLSLGFADQDSEVQVQMRSIDKE